MIYLAALHVVSFKGEDGINAMMYEVAGATPRTEAGAISLPAAMDIERGPPVRALTALRTGGNRVRSYLDVVLDQPSPTALEQAVAALDDRLKTGAPPLRLEAPAFAIEFNSEIGLHGIAADEAKRLGAQLSSLLHGAPGAWSPELAPLVIEVHEGEDEIVLSLDDESARRVARERGGGWNRPRLRFEHGVFADLEATLEDTWGELAMMLTGLKPTRLMALGGVRYDAVGSGRRRALIEWPERA